MIKLAARRPALHPDAEIIRTLAELLSETGLSEIEYAIGDHRIRVARETAAPTPPVNGHKHPEPVAAPEPVEPAPPPVPAAPVKNAEALPGTLTSPIVGVAYLAPQPGAAPFVKLGDTITEGQTLLIIEAMKVMNQIRARRSGRVTQIFVEDASPVEYGAPLMLIE